MSKKQSRTEKRKAAEEAKKAPLTAYKDPPCEGCPVTACPVGVDQGSDLCTALREPKCQKGYSEKIFR